MNPVNPYGPPAEALRTLAATSGWGFPSTFPHTAMSAFSALPAVNYAVFGRVLGAGTISKIGLYVGTASGNISVGVATGPRGRSNPAKIVQSSGAVACPAAGYQEVALGASVDVSEGDWLAISADNTTATFFGVGATAATATDYGKGIAAVLAAAHPLPTDVSAAVGARAMNIQLIGVA